MCSNVHFKCQKYYIEEKPLKGFHVSRGYMAQAGSTMSDFSVASYFIILIKIVDDDAGT